MTNELQTKQAELGKSIVDAAEHRRQQRKQELVMQNVESLLSTSDEQVVLIAKHTRRLNLVTARIAALKDGAFDITKTGTIVYTDKKLNPSDFGVNAVEVTDDLT